MYYGCDRNGNEIKFYCDNVEIVNDVYDYITRYIDAQNYRSMLRECKKLEWEIDQEGWLMPSESED